MFFQLIGRKDGGSIGFSMRGGDCVYSWLSLEGVVNRCIKTVLIADYFSRKLRCGAEEIKPLT